MSLNNDFKVSTGIENNRWVFKKEIAQENVLDPEKNKKLDDIITSIAQIPLYQKTRTQRFISSIKEFFLTMFDWKYVKIVDNDTNQKRLVNINSLVDKLGLTPDAVRKLAKEGMLEEECKSLAKDKALKHVDSPVSPAIVVPIPSIIVPSQRYQDILGKLKLPNDGKCLVSCYYNYNAKGEFEFPILENSEVNQDNTIHIERNIDINPGDINLYFIVLKKEGLYQIDLDHSVCQKLKESFEDRLAKQQIPAELKKELAKKFMD